MAPTANRNARELLALVNAAASGTRSFESGCHCQASWFHRYALGSGRLAGTGWDRIPGWAVGHSARRSGGGLTVPQSAKDIVRDHRNSPALLVRLNEPFAAANHDM